MQFSVITITFNSEKYLQQTLDSVAKQNFTDYEHIIWDGGSNDNTLAICHKYPHLRIIEGKDEGISDAMNKAAKHATGNFLLFIHSDDFLSDECTLSLIDTYIKQHPEAQWFYGRCNIVDENSSLVKEQRAEPYSHKRLRKYNIISHPATLVSRNLFEQVGGFDISLRYCMDYDLWLRLAEITDAWVMPVLVSCFREHEGSVSTRDLLNVADESYHVRNKYVKGPLERIQSHRTWLKRRKNASNG